jgi:hypothetical protein
MGEQRGMPDARRQAESQNNQALLDRCLAYLLLRLTLGSTSCSTVPCGCLP